MLDDYQSNSATGVTEGNMDDPDGTFTNSAAASNLSSINISAFGDDFEILPD